MITSNAYDDWSSGLSASEVETLFRSRGCAQVLVKQLADRQDNDKNQIYAGRDLADLGLLPSGEVEASVTSSSKPGVAGRTKFQANLDLTWIGPFGNSNAPNAKLIFYPQYPEVRISGFLSQSPGAPRELLAREQRGQEAGRVLLLGIGDRGQVWGLALSARARSREHVTTLANAEYGAFRIWHLEVSSAINSQAQLLAEISNIAALGWMPGRRLSRGRVAPYRAPNGGGYTLEALLGIEPNGRAEPDFMGWELKQHGVRSLDRPHTGIITMFTPEPDGGLYREKGVESFLLAHGYPDRHKPNRTNFGGVYTVGGMPHTRTGLTLELFGFRSPTNFDPDGEVALVGRDGKRAASWSFSKLMNHWKRKHAAACFVPAVSRFGAATREYRFGSNVLLGTGATFGHLLRALDAGAVYYDPGIKMELDATGRRTSKRRSQFRARFADVPELYAKHQYVDANAT